MRYQPIVWPIKVARKAPAIPSTVVRMKPLGLFGPGESMRAMMPAMKPTTMIQMKPDTGTSLASYVEGCSAVSAFEPLVAFAVIAAALFDPLHPTIAIVGLVRVVLIEAGLHAGLAGRLFRIFRSNRRWKSRGPGRADACRLRAGCLLGTGAFGSSGLRVGSGR